MENYVRILDEIKLSFSVGFLKEAKSAVKLLQCAEVGQ
jgi:hypothetical protein